MIKLRSAKLKANFLLVDNAIASIDQAKRWLQTSARKKNRHMGIPMNTYVIPMCFMGIEYLKSVFRVNRVGFSEKCCTNTDKYPCFNSFSTFKHYNIQTFLLCLKCSYWLIFKNIQSFSQSIIQTL